MKSLIAAAVAFVMLFLFFVTNYYTIQPYERGIKTFGGNYAGIAEPGMHFTMPFVGAVRKVDVSQLQFTTAKLNTYTVDNQEVDATLVVQYQYPETELEYIYKNVGFDPTILGNMVVDRWKIEAGKVNVGDIANNRGKLVKSVFDIVKSEALRLYHINVTDVQLYNLDYMDSYRAAQAQASTVKTQIEAASGLREKAQIDADRAKIEASGVANQQIEKARGEAETIRLKAVAEAESTRIRGTAEANAQKQMADALTANPELVELTKAQRWNGALPTQMVPGGSIPFFSVK